MYQAVARRTRSKNPWVVGGELAIGRKRRKVDEDDDEVICLGENLEGKRAAGEKFASASGVGASCSSPDDMKNGFVYLGETQDDPDPDPEELVDLEDHDGAEVRIKCYETKGFQVKEEERDEEGEGCSVSAGRADKGKSFDDDDEYGTKPEKPVVLLPHSFRNGRSSSDEGYDSLWSSTESEDVETSDDDFKVDEEDDDDDVESEYSSSEESDSSEDDERKGYKLVKERVRKVVSESESSRVWRRKDERKKKHVEKELVEKWNGGDSASVASSKSENETERAQENRERENRVDTEVLSDQGKSSVLSVSSDDDALEDKEKGVRDHQSVFFQKETRNSTAINKCGKNKKVKANAKETGHKDELHEMPRMSSTTKNHCFEFFNECFRGKRHSAKDVSRDLDKKVGVGEGETRPFGSRETISLNWNFMMKEKLVEKSESEKELDILWEEMEMLLQAEKIGAKGGEKDESRETEENLVPRCKHDTIFNEQIGIYCRWCGWVETEIKYMYPPFIDSERYGRRVSSGGGNASRLDGVLFSECGEDWEAVRSRNHGTVWDLTPGIKESLFPHQQEGFEFIWENLAGTIELSKLKMVDPESEGGCIVSHAPGTGKTRLTMVFLQTYLQVFPNCLPIIIAPANILLTWEDELRKWNIGIPFHNLNNAELTGKEHAIREVDWLFNQQQKKDVIRMLKLCSWYKEKSILLISYNLYEKLAGGKSEGDGEKEKNNRKNGKQKKNRKIGKEKKRVETELGNVLRDYPDLLVLDEGHTPRNKRSCIWKVLSESRSQKRILLSGTPFQNNFLELYNILCLMKPSFPDSIPQELKKFLKNKLIQETKASKDESWEPISAGNQADEKINQLKLLMNPFVHVHKGSILQKNLPGLRDCVLVLKPECLQKRILESIDCSQNALNFEHKLALTSVHPSLFLNCALSKKEESVIDSKLLEKIRLHSYEGVKTKFLIEFVRLCDAVNEKVLVFSQFIDTLCLIRDQLESAYNWSVGTDVLYMHGKLDQKQKQFLIHNFNDAKSQAKVLLASIKASSEGINLVGASRVVLVDVVWNPSVERQAICRAYRLGQKRVVYTYHLLAQGTPECAKYDKQSEKDRLSELVFSSRNVENDKLENAGMKFEDKVLDLMVQHNSLKDIFGQCLVQPKDRDLETLGS
ncbi:SNF2 domain-containing protein CLASSY 4-like [Vigna radiata var. radiata]|uniref:SNF2 domain-containing protein CLASSY 4-like n=1 Tax=Vigna radiata var. radiata TaxID=3916 RepID=A0A1S3VXN2_VIGRR|nr:SNF2 domain-containing protein CLASSY 4-like [Vigna radiata var. radiata]